MTVGASKSLGLKDGLRTGELPMTQNGVAHCMVSTDRWFRELVVENPAVSSCEIGTVIPYDEYDSSCSSQGKPDKR